MVKLVINIDSVKVWVDFEKDFYYYCKQIDTLAGYSAFYYQGQQIKCRTKAEYYRFLKLKVLF